MAYKIATHDGWNYWQAGSKPRAFKTRDTEFFEFAKWEDMADELRTFGIVHPWQEPPPSCPKCGYAENSPPV